jgi:enoyl-CoA hydratase/carnithine racemase
MTERVVETKMIAEHVALVTINRPDARNAINAEVAKGLDRAVLHTEEDENIWCVILTGAGEKAFCAGADLKAVSSEGPKALSTDRGGFAGFVHQKRAKPWIAAINGFALAGGMEIALACEMIVACENTSFGLPEVKRGLIASAGGLYRLPRVLPRSLALELILTGEFLDAKRAFEFGLVNRLVRPEKLIEESLGLAELVCANAPIAVRESLRVASQALDLDDASLQFLSQGAFRKVQMSEDFKEGPLAFIERRAPRWTGR